jgi:hypothetical protein
MWYALVQLLVAWWLLFFIVLTTTRNVYSSFSYSFYLALFGFSVFKLYTARENRTDDLGFVPWKTRLRTYQDSD